MGSYFGDSDIFQDGIQNDRDSTAKADQECNFFVISRSDITIMKKSFPQEVREMRTLAVQRKKRHVRLIQKLRQKVLAI
jgi:hypothetical protein